MEYVYAALLLHQAGKPVSQEAVSKVVEAAGFQADESKAKTLIASLQGVDIDKAISEAGSMAAAPSAGAGKAEAKPEQKEEKHEAAAEGLAALFG